MSIEKDKAQLEVLSLGVSPFSIRVIWALRLMKVEYKPLEYAPIAGELPLRWRLGRWKLWERVTVPVGFVTIPSKPELHLEHGLDIVEWAAEEARPKDAPHLIPAETRGEIVAFCKIADVLQEFDRQIFLKASWEDPSLLGLMMGDDGPPAAALPVISFISGTIMSIKYRSTLRTTVPEIRDKLEVLEKEIVRKQEEKSKKELVYLVGNSVSLADLYVSVSLCGGPRQKPKDEDDEKLYQAISQHSLDIRKEYPVLSNWALDIVEKHGVTN